MIGECMMCCMDFPCEIIENDVANIYDINEIKSGYLVISCCLKKDHLLCRECMRRLALSYDTHMINGTNSHMFCPYMDGCTNESGIRNFFDHSLIRKFLSPQEFEIFLEYAERFAYPGYEAVKCKDCKVPNIIPHNEIRDADDFGLIIRCSQNPVCFSIYCYICEEDLSDYDIFCKKCKDKSENTNPSSFNKYFYKPLEYRSNSLSERENYFFRNKELTNEIIIGQLKEIVTEPYVRCPVCLIKIYKTEQCNSVEHCGVEFCYVCNRKTPGKLHDHWSELGNNGCFRFDSSQLIRCTLKKYKCSEGYCFGHDIGDCKVESHQEGVREMRDFRTYNLIYHMLKSLLWYKRDEVIYIISCSHPDIHEYVTDDFEYKNYYDYLPPIKLKCFNIFSILESEAPERPVYPIVPRFPPPVQTFLGAPMRVLVPGANVLDVLDEYSNEEVESDDSDATIVIYNADAENNV